MPFRYFITKRYLFHFTLKSLVATILTRPYFFLTPFPFSGTFGNVTKDLTTVLSQGNSWCISVPPPQPVSILCSVKRARFRAGNFACVFFSLVCFGTANLTPLYNECSFADRCLCTTFIQCWESEGAAHLVRMSKKLTKVGQRVRGEEIFIERRRSKEVHPDLVFSN